MSDTKPGAGDLILARIERIPFTRLHFRTAAILGTGTFSDAYDALAIASALTVIFTQLDISLANIGLLLGIGYLGQFVGAVVASALAERYGRKPLFIAAIAAFSIFGLGTALSWDFGSLVVFRVLQGLGLGAEIPIASALFSELIRIRNRGRVYLAYQNLFGWGSFLTPLMAAGILAMFSPEVAWRVVLGIGALPIILAVVAARLLPESPRWLVNKGHIDAAEQQVSTMEKHYEARKGALPTPQAPAKLDFVPTRFTELLSRQFIRRTVLIWTMFATSYFVVYAFLVWLPSLYVRGGLSPSHSLLLTSLNGLSFVLSGYVFAFLSDRVGRKRYFLVNYTLAAVGALLGVVAIRGFGLSGWPILFAVTLVLAIGIFPINIGLYLYSPELFPTRMRAWATGTGSGIQRLATAAAPYVVGWTLALSGDNGIPNVFLLLLVVTVVGLVVVAILGVETAGKPLAETTTQARTPAPDTTGA